MMMMMMMIIIIIIIIKEIQRMWHMKTVVIPVVIGALGTVKKGMVENIKKVSERATMTEIQKICMNPQKGAQCMNRMIDLSD